MDIYNEVMRDFQARMGSKLSNRELEALLHNLRNTKINVLLVGGTGVGKSSTINALLNAQQATVGTSSKPETVSIEKYELKNINIWDTPGLGDSTENDAKYKNLIIDKLNEKASDGTALIDLVFLILDGGSRDYSTAYTLLKDVIIPNLGADSQKRLLIGINQADMALKGRYWNAETNQPEPKLVEFLEEKVQSTKERIFADSQLDITPIYYSAGFLEGEISQKPYNLAKLLDTILEKLPSKKRAVVMNDVSQDPTNFQSNDNAEDYAENIEQKVTDSIWENIKNTLSDLAKKGIQVISDATSEFLKAESTKEAFKAAATAVGSGAFTWMKTKLTDKLKGK